ncbi:MAG: 23S rRNA pseudouridine(2604) synthase RluF [Clostridia bacterium]|nr:23S rRNA pseudouridine(2604) synthase RluF [Clostridia bacterium]MBO4884446.1 23S rRNA pseudouridine(2604) synthase RluF [Clostridia bacterium]MBR4443610.1 23S rRNA pseudouridine(2604) synthase RluF [Clostridia bacterium]
MNRDEPPREGVRLNKWIAESGLCSRREADRLIAEGRVTIDGRRGALGDRVLPGMTVLVNGRDARARTQKQQVYIALNKPVGVVCTADPREPMNVVDFVGHPQRIFPVGRLDKDSEGLLLLTSDGEIVNRILRAAGRHEKEYLVEVDKPITSDFLNRMAEGVPILDTVTLPCRVTREDRQRFRIVLVQGLNRQIRRMCEALGYKVTSLRRERVMNIRLGRLKSGHWRNLTPAELNELMRQLDD